MARGQTSLLPTFRLDFWVPLLLELLDTAFFLGPCNCLGVGHCYHLLAMVMVMAPSFSLSIRCIFLLAVERKVTAEFIAMARPGLCLWGQALWTPLSLSILPYRLQHFLSNQYLIRSGQVIGLKKDIYLLMRRGRGMPWSYMKLVSIDLW